MSQLKINKLTQLLQFHRRQLDDTIIENNSVLITIDEAEARPFSVDGVRVEDWEFQWVSENYPKEKTMLIAKPTNARTKTISVIGRTRWLMESFNISDTMALNLVRAMWGVKNAMHRDRLQNVVDFLLCRTDEIKSQAALSIITQYQSIVEGSFNGPKFPIGKFNAYLEKLHNAA